MRVHVLFEGSDPINVKVKMRVVMVNINFGGR